MSDPSPGLRRNNCPQQERESQTAFSYFCKDFFIYGCAVSSPGLSAAVANGGLRFLIAVSRLLLRWLSRGGTDSGTWSSVVVVHGLQSPGWVVVVREASLPHSMWDLPVPGMELVCPALAGGFPANWTRKPQIAFTFSFLSASFRGSWRCFFHVFRRSCRVNWVGFQLMFWGFRVLGSKSVPMVYFVFSFQNSWCFSLFFLYFLPVLLFGKESEINAFDLLP